VTGMRRNRVAEAAGVIQQTLRTTSTVVCWPSRSAAWVVTR
jgi:hypothetical protein